MNIKLFPIRTGSENKRSLLDCQIEEKMPLSTQFPLVLGIPSFPINPYHLNCRSDRSPGLTNQPLSEQRILDTRECLFVK